jgi:hypothetical protein
MERLTRTIVTVKEDLSIQNALDKLSAYEDAEEAGRLLFIPSVIWYIAADGTVNMGEVLSIFGKHLLVEEGPDYEFIYKFKTANGFEVDGILGKDVFTTKEAAEEKATADLFVYEFETDDKGDIVEL